MFGCVGFCDKSRWVWFGSINKDSRELEWPDEECAWKMVLHKKLEQRPVEESAERSVVKPA